MAIRVPRPVQPGQVGDVQRDPVRQDIQRFDVPLLDQPAKTAGLLGAGLTDFSEFQLQLAEEQETLALLQTQDTGDAEARTIIQGELSQLGGNAVGAGDRALEAYETLVTQLKPADNLTAAGEAAHKAYLRSLKNTILNGVASHEREQTRVHTIEMIDTSIANAQDKGVLAFNDDEVLIKQMGLIYQRAKARADMTAVPGSDEAKELSEKLAREAISKMYLGAINRALAQPETHKRAEALLIAARESDLLDAGNGDLANAEAAVETGGTLNTAQEQATVIMLGDNGNDLIAALAEARAFAGEDSALEKSLVAEVAARFGERKAADALDLKAKKTEAVALARKGEFNKIEPSVLAELGGTMTSTLQNISARFRRKAALFSDPSIYNKLNRMLDDDLAKEDLLTSEYLENLSESDFRKFSDRQSTLLNATDPTVPAVVSAQRTRTQIVNQALAAADITNDVEIKGFNDALDNAIFALELDTQKKATPQQVQELADLLLIDGEYEGGPGSFADPDVYVFELQQGQQFMLDDLSDIPEHDLIALRAAAEANGQADIKDDDLLELYNEHLRRRIAAAGVGQ